MVPDGKYLYNRDAQRIEIQWVEGIGSDKAAAPQARLMATVINGILNRQLPWRLVLLGVFLVISIELLGVRSLHRSSPWGLIYRLRRRRRFLPGAQCAGSFERSRGKGEESEVGSGPLYASGLIAGGGIFFGLFGIVLALLQDQEFRYTIFSRRAYFRSGRRFWAGWRRATRWP